VDGASAEALISPPDPLARASLCSWPTDTLLLDLRLGLRSLSRAPAFTAAAVIALALGIGAACAIFAFCDAMLLHPFPFPH